MGLCLVSTTLSAAASKDSEEPAAQSAEPVRVLLITGGHDFERQPFFEMFSAMPGISWKEIVQPEANKHYTTAAVKDYDVIVLYDFVQDITEEQKTNLARVLREEGKGLVGLHHCLANYQKWPEFLQILGGRYYMEKMKEGGEEREPSTYDHDQRFTVEVVDPNHPITKGMSNFEIQDETYGLFYVRPEVTPLLRVQHPKSGPVIGWAHNYGKAHVAYIQLGHDHTAYTNPHYRQLVLSAIRWAAKK